MWVQQSVYLRKCFFGVISICRFIVFVHDFSICVIPYSLQNFFPSKTAVLATHVTVILSHDLISTKDSWKTVVIFVLIIDFDVSQCLTYSELLVQAPAAWRMIAIEWCLYGAAWRYVSLLTQSPFQENGHFPRTLYRKCFLNLRKFGSFKQTHDRREGPCEWNVC